MAKNLAIAYSIKSKNKKKMASGGMAKNESAKSESRPMPNERDKDAHQVSRNSGNKPPQNDGWGDNITIKQAQKPSITKLSQPKMVGSDAFSVRNRDMHDDEADMMDRLPPQSDRARPPQRDDEDGPNRQGPKVPDMAAQHSNKRAPYNKAIEDQYAQDMAAAEMKKVQSYAQGGPVMEPEDHGDELMERHDESDLMDLESPSEDEGSSEAHSLNEEDADGSNPNHLDMEDEHSNGRKPYAKGGEVDGAKTSTGGAKTGGAKTSTTGNKTKTGGSNPGGASTGGAGTVTITTRDLGSKGINVSNVGGKTDSKNHGGMDPGDEDDDGQALMASGGSVESGSRDMNYADGGEIDDSLSHEEDEEHEDSIAAAIMAKKDREMLMMSDSDMDEMERLYKGGEIESHDSIYSDDSDQADLSRNADEDANEEDQTSFNALRKENYSESEGLDELDSPRDSAQHGDSREDDSENEHDMISSIRSQMNKKRQFKQR